MPVRLQWYMLNEPVPPFLWGVLSCQNSPNSVKLVPRPMTKKNHFNHFRKLTPQIHAWPWLYQIIRISFQCAHPPVSTITTWTKKTRLCNDPVPTAPPSILHYFHAIGNAPGRLVEEIQITIIVKLWQQNYTNKECVCLLYCCSVVCYFPSYNPNRS